MEQRLATILALTALVDQMAAELQDPATTTTRKQVITAQLRELFRRLKSLGVEGLDQ